MSTSKSQRIGIWVIAVVLFVGTIGSFFVVILANNNNTKDQASLQQQATEYQAKVDAQNNDLWSKYGATLTDFAGQVGAFNADEVTSVTSKDLKEGDGAVIGDTTSYSAYYIGWNPEGKIFDQSGKDATTGKAKPPIPGSGLIAGWTEGVKGMKIGGVREISINADKAYGDAGSGDLIPPHTPIKFIVLAIPTPTTIPMPAALQSAQSAQTVTQ